LENVVYSLRNSYSTWVVYVEGSSASKRSGVGVILLNPKGQVFRFAVKLNFVTTNNEAEYEAVITGLSISREVGATNVEIRSDSQVVVGQVQGEFDTQEVRMARYLEKVLKLQSCFERVIITKILKETNTATDELSKLASRSDQEIEASDQEVIVLAEPSIAPKSDVMELDTAPAEPEWATDVIQYLKNGLLHEDKVVARKVKLQAARYSLLGGILYKIGYSEPLLKCLSKDEAEYVMREIHEGVCGNHLGARMLAHKATRAGYYWPSMSKDTAQVVKHCDKCQRFSRVVNSHPEKFTAITSPWPFTKWGVDIVGPMPPGKGSKKFFVVVVDYLTKWAEVEAMTAITTTNVITFLWRSVVYRFGILQFDCKQFRKWCSELCVRNYYSNVLRPKANGQVEATNKTLMRTLKKKLQQKKGA
jgi:ribonuclease HI